MGSRVQELPLPMHIQCRYGTAHNILFLLRSYDGQVSKTAPTGEYLTTGSFMIRGICQAISFIYSTLCINCVRVKGKVRLNMG